MYMYTCTADHDIARARHAERQERGLAGFAARQARRRPGVSRDRCPLSLLAAWIVSRRRRAIAAGTVAFEGR